jgi:positive regulator of sigma E activity
MMSNMISHPGIVKKITEEGIEVIISAESACGTCSSASSCPASEMKEKMILVKDAKVEVTPGEHVLVVMHASLGRLAVAVAYLFPLVVMLAVLFLSHGLGFSDGISALSAMAITLVYFLVVWLFRNRLGKTFLFSIEKLHDP